MEKRNKNSKNLQTLELAIGCLLTLMPLTLISSGGAENMIARLLTPDDPVRSMSTAISVAYGSLVVGAFLIAHATPGKIMDNSFAKGLLLVLFLFIFYVSLAMVNG